MNPQAENWLKQAKYDLETAEELFRLNRWAACALHAQQAAEKALKALIVANVGGGVPPRIHSIQKLADIANITADMPEDAIKLDDVYIASRYPEAAGFVVPYELIDEDKAETTLTTASEIVELVSAKLS